MPKRNYPGRTIIRIYGDEYIREGLIRFYESVDEFKDLVEPLKKAIDYTIGK